MSAKTGQGVDEVRRRILKSLGVVPRHVPGEAVVFTPRQEQILARAARGGRPEKAKAERFREPEYAGAPVRLYCSMDATNTPRPYRLMSWNVHHCVGIETATPSNGCRRDREHEPDVRAAGARSQPQAIPADPSAQPDGRAAQDGLSLSSGPDPRGGRLRNAVFTRHSMKESRTAALPTFRFLQKRGAVWMSVELDGHPVQIINTHFGLLRRERMMHLRPSAATAGWTIRSAATIPDRLRGFQRDAPLEGLQDARHPPVGRHEAGRGPGVRTWPSLRPSCATTTSSSAKASGPLGPGPPDLPDPPCIGPLPVLMDFHVGPRPKKDFLTFFRQRVKR